MPAALPKKLHLPSGRVVAIELAAPGASVSSTLRGAVKALAGDPVRLVSEGSTLDPEQLDLEDFHVLRVVLTRAGLLAEQPVQVPCENCNRMESVRPCEAFEPGPFLDGELYDPELDHPFEFDEQHELGGELTMRLRRLTVGEARMLHEAIDAGHIRLTGPMVKAMGIVSFDGQTQAPKIARMLQGIDDHAWDVVTDLLDSAWYGPRLRAWWRCNACGARNEVDAPALREFPALPLPREDGPIEGFPELPAFEAMVQKHTEEIFGRLGVRNVDVIVEPGVPECDDGGVPLLGSYDPGTEAESGVPSAPPEIRIYYRTFRATFADQPFDVGAEIAETVEHEVRHHLAYLSGYDEQDDREHDEIAIEHGRMVGESESLRRATRAAGSDLFSFLRATWPIWLLVAVLSIVAVMASR
jgi:hypothetical protein